MMMVSNKEGTIGAAFLFELKIETQAPQFMHKHVE
jgi:hypothetical protein